MCTPSGLKAAEVVGVLMVLPPQQVVAVSGRVQGALGHVQARVQAGLHCFWMGPQVATCVAQGCP